MDELNNRQMILLTMLTAFVVSVGTGIMTVAMLEEAPPTLTQTVNRVVERTIERVVTGSTTPEKKSVSPVNTTIEKEVIIYAKEDDLIIDAVAKNHPRIVSIYSTQEVGAPAIASGFIVSRDGVIATDFKKISTESGLRESYRIVLNEKTYTATPIKSDAMTKSAVGLLKISDMKEGDVFDAVTFGKQVDPKIAQTVIVMGGEDGLSVFRSILARFHYANPSATSTPKVISTIDTASKIPGEYAGSLATNLDGQAMGIVLTGDIPTSLVIYPALRILDLVAAVSAEGRNVSGATGGGKVSTNP